MPTLQPDDLTPGIFIASTRYTHVHPGTPLHVVALNLPFISVQAITPLGISPPFALPVSLPFHSLTPDYVASFFPPSATTETHLLRGREILTPPPSGASSHGSLPPS